MNFNAVLVSVRGFSKQNICSEKRSSQTLAGRWLVLCVLVSKILFPDGGWDVRQTYFEFQWDHCKINNFHLRNQWDRFLCNDRIVCIEERNFMEVISFLYFVSHSVNHIECDPFPVE